MDTTSPIAHYIGVDVGTGSVRACIINHEGSLLAIASEDTKTWQSAPECYEQSTNDIWGSICTSVKAAMRAANIDKETVRSIAFTATCSLAVLATDTGEPIPVNRPDFSPADHNVVLWMHRAATQEAKTVNATKHNTLKYLGGSVSPLMALPKVLWLKNNMPKELFQRCRFFDLHDALAHMATGGTAYDCTNPCSHTKEQRGYGIDGSIKGWSDEILDSIDLHALSMGRSDQVGGMCRHGNTPSPGTAQGTLSQNAARQLGLTDRVTVAAGVIDSYAGWIGTTGARVDDPNSSYNFMIHERLATVAGTSTCHILASNHAGFTEGVWGPYKDYLLPAHEIMEGGQSATGRLIRHVLESHPAYSEAEKLAHSEQLSIFEFCDKQLLRMQQDLSAPNITWLGRHIFFYGDHFGNRSPISDPAMTGSIVGLTGDTSVDNLVLMYYSALEFIALQTRHIISAMEQSGHKIRSVFMSGSLCQNKILIDLIATACGLPVITPKYIKAAVGYGAALLAARAMTVDESGQPEELWSVMQRLSKPGTLYLPIQDQYMWNLLEAKYKIFLEQAERQRAFRKMIDEVPRE